MKYELLNDSLNYEVLKVIHDSFGLIDEDLKDSIKLYNNLEVLSSLESLMSKGLVNADENGLFLTDEAYQSLSHFSMKLLDKSDDFGNTAELLGSGITYLKIVKEDDLSFVKEAVIDWKASSKAYLDVHELIERDFFPKNE